MTDKLRKGVIDDPTQARKLFPLSIDDLVNVVEKYRQRTYDEDITYIDQKLKGMSGLA